MLYIQLDKTHNNLKEFLIDCIHLSKFRTTWNDPNFTQMQCYPAYRSFEDLLELSKTYFSDTTEEILAKTLFELSTSNQLEYYGTPANLCAWYCYTIDKIVFFPMSIQPNISTFKDGITKNADSKLNTSFDEKGKGKYSMREIYTFAGKNIEIDD